MNLKDLLSCAHNSDTCTELFSFLDSSHCNSTLQSVLRISVNSSSSGHVLCHIESLKAQTFSCPTIACVLPLYFLDFSVTNLLLRRGYVPNSQVVPGHSLSLITIGRLLLLQFLVKYCYCHGYC